MQWNIMLSIKGMGNALLRENDKCRLLIKKKKKHPLAFFPAGCEWWASLGTTGQDQGQKKAFPQGAEVWAGTHSVALRLASAVYTQSDFGEATVITVPGGWIWGISPGAPSVLCTKQGSSMLSANASINELLHQDSVKNYMMMTAHLPTMDESHYVLSLDREEAQLTPEEEEIKKKKRSKKMKKKYEERSKNAQISFWRRSSSRASFLCVSQEKQASVAGQMALC